MVEQAKASTLSKNFTVLSPENLDSKRDQNSLILVAKRLLAGPAGEALSEVELGAEALSGARATGRRGRGSARCGRRERDAGWRVGAPQRRREVCEGVSVVG